MGWLHGWVRVGTLLQEFRQRGVVEEEEDVGREGEEEDGEGGICVPECVCVCARMEQVTNDQQQAPK